MSEVRSLFQKKFSSFTICPMILALPLIKKHVNHEQMTKKCCLYEKIIHPLIFKHWKKKKVEEMRTYEKKRPVQREFMSLDK